VHSSSSSFYDCLTTVVYGSRIADSLVALVRSLRFCGYFNELQEFKCMDDGKGARAASCSCVSGEGQSSLYSRSSSSSSGNSAWASAKATSKPLSQAYK
jgi:hypothetical protein